MMIRMKIKGKKAQVQITLIPEVAKKAHALGLNISKVSENALKQAINSLEQTKSQNNCFSLSEGSLSPKRESSRWTERELNPRPPECKSGIHTRLNYRPTNMRALFDDRS